VVNFRILGPLEVVDEGRVIPLARRKSRALLALLLLNVNEPVSTDRLVDELWNGEPPKTAVASLQNHISRLRKALGRNLIVSTPAGYELRVPAEAVDLACFEQLLAAARAAEGAARAEKLREALALWRGEPLADLAYEEFAQTEIARLDELKLTALEERIDADLAIGRHGELVGELEALVARNPLRERLRGQLMLALYRSGRQADALGAFQDARRVLREELGLDPGAELQRLERAILQHDAEIAAPRAAAEALAPARRRVTLVFADVSAGEGDPEALYARTRGFLSAATGAVERHGGRIERLGSDQVVAVFGLPAAHEDDALRAVRAAVEMRAAGRRDEGLEVQSAVETGEVLVVEDAVSGDVVVRSKRLARSAAPGDVLVGPQTLRLVRDAVKVKRGSVGGAVRLEEVQADAPAITRRFDAPMVGREDELARLRGLYERVRDGNRCAVVTLIGEAGIGKTRLARELVTSIGDEARTLVGRCVSYGEGATYLPVADIVRSLGVESEERLHALLAGEEDAEAVGRRVAELVGLTESAGAVGEAFWAVRRLLEALARERPLIVVFDDVHWAEPTFLDLVEYLAEWSSEAPILVLCPARPDLLEARPGLAGAASSITSIRLSPLGRSQTLELVDTLASEDELGPEARDRIVEAAEGNPLFAEQLYAYAAEEGGLEDVPPSVDALLRSRLDSLDQSERALLQRAAVVGREFRRDAVIALSPRADLADIDARLQSLTWKGLVSPRLPTLADENAYRFHHVLVRDVAYAGTAKSVRSELHERCADWLDGRPQGLDEVVGYHLEQAHRYRTELGARDRHVRSLAAEAGQRLGSAGVRALMRGDIPAAANLLGRATALLPSDDPRSLELTCELGIACRAAGESARAEQLLADTVQSAAAIRDRRLELRAEIELRLVRLHTRTEGAPDKLLAFANEAIPTLESLDDDRSLGRAWFAIGYVEGCFYCRNARWEEAAERSRAHYRHAGWSTALAMGQIAAALLYGPAPVDRGIRQCQELLASEADERLGEAHVRLLMGGLEGLRGRFDVGHALIQQARGSYEELGQSVNARSCDSLDGLIAMLSGDPVEGELAFRRSFETAERVADWSSLAICAADLADALYGQGRLAEAQNLTLVSEEHAARDDLPAQFSWRAVRAKILARTDEFVQAETLAREAVDLVAETDALFQHGKLLVDLAEVLEISGQRRDAVAVTGEALALFRRKGASAFALDTEARLRELAVV
jgi:DNA-binding SARP family transcriptional activator